MYEIVKSVILDRRFDLPAMLKKIDTLWVQGDITDEQRSELIDLGRANANPDVSIGVMTLINDLEERMTKVEAKLEGGQLPVDPSNEYPEFQPNHVYVKGDKITYNGKKYECILNEHTDRTTWSPGDYPAYWREVV